MKTIVKNFIRLNLVILSAFFLTGSACIGTDPFVEPWLLDATLRCEGAGKATIRFTDGNYLFYVDRGELFSSTKNKMGYSTRDGATYCFVEWNGDFSVGAKSGATLRTQSSTVTLETLKVVKSVGGIVWVAYTQNSTAEGRIILELGSVN